jgi:hypothetical protein
MSISKMIGRYDFVFENSTVRIVASRNSPEIKLAGINIGPFEEGNEYEVNYWVAQELEKSAIARFREEEQLDANKFYKIQWKERAQTVGQISNLPNDFYPKMRRYLAKSTEEAAKTPEKMLECKKVNQLAQDVLNSRLKKIVSIAAAPDQTEQTLKNLTGEERHLYMQLHKLIHEWRKQIIKCEATEE